MEYKHKTFGSLAVRTRYAYQLTFLTEEVDLMNTIDDAETIVFTSARMALKVMTEIEADENIVLLEFKEILMHV
jgi:hypothetical protein